MPRERVDAVIRIPPKTNEIFERIVGWLGIFFILISTLRSLGRVYWKYSTAFLNNFIPSPSSGSGSLLRLSSSLMRVQSGWFVKQWKRSGCGIMPSIRPDGSLIAAMSSNAPFGL